MQPTPRLMNTTSIMTTMSSPFGRSMSFRPTTRSSGFRYGITSLIFLAIGFFLMMVMRWSIAYPDRPLPMIGDWPFFSKWIGDDGLVTGDLYNMFGAMHGTIMVFLGVVPLAFGAFGNYATPLQIGAPDMAFPRLNMASYWFYFVGGVLDVRQFLPRLWRGQVGMDEFTATGKHYRQPFPRPFLDQPDAVVDGDGVPDQFFPARCGELHYDDHQSAS